MADQMATVEILEFQPTGFPGVLRDWVDPHPSGDDYGDAGTQGIFI
jgi:hypothetical protein